MKLVVNFDQLNVIEELILEFNRTEVSAGEVTVRGGTMRWDSIENIEIELG